MNVKTLFSVFWIALLITIVVGCSTTVKSDYVLKTEEQLVAQMKAEHPECFVSQTPIKNQDASKLIGEWEVTEYIFVQCNSIKYMDPLSKSSSTSIYQFFADGTYNCRNQFIVMVVHSTATQGTWSYTNNILQLHALVDNIMQRYVPRLFVWYSDSLAEVQFDINEYRRKTRSNFDESYKCQYSTNGCLVIERTDTLKQKWITVKTPCVWRKVGAAVKPPVGMQNQIVHDEGLKALLNANQNTVNAQQQIQVENNRVMAEAIAEGINSFSQNVSQINNPPPTPTRPAYTPMPQMQPTTPKPTYTPKQIPTYQRIPRASSFGRSGNLPSTDWNTRNSTGLQRVR